MSDAPVKVVVDCSQAGGLDPENAATLAAGLRESALVAIANDDIGKATRLIQDAKDIAAGGVATAAQISALTDDEAAQLAADQAEHAALADAAHAERLTGVVAQCDRWLAQTDWIMTPAAGRPTDMSANLAKACDKHAAAWKTWRNKVRKIRDAAAAGTLDPSAPGFPDQPPAPEIALV